MARKPNYNFERREREQLKAEKKAKRAAEKKEAREKNPGNPNNPRKAMAKTRYHPLSSDRALVPLSKD